MMSAVVVVTPMAAGSVVVPVAVAIVVPPSPVIPLPVLPPAPLVIPGLLRRRLLAAVLLLLTLLVVHEIVEDGRGVAVRVHYPQHLQALGVGHLLGVPRVRYRLVVVVLQPDVAELYVGHVLHIYPSYLRKQTKDMDFSMDSIQSDQF